MTALDPARLAASAYFDKGRCSGHHQFNGRYCRDVAGPEQWCIHCAGFMLLAVIAHLQGENDQAKLALWTHAGGVVVPTGHTLTELAVQASQSREYLQSQVRQLEADLSRLQAERDEVATYLQVSHLDHAKTASKLKTCQENYAWMKDKRETAEAARDEAQRTLAKITTAAYRVKVNNGWGQQHATNLAQEVYLLAVTKGE